MGFNTAIMVCNDGMDQLKVDPTFGAKLYNAILQSGRRRDGYGTSFSVGNHCNPVSVLPSQHADCAQVVIVGGNSIKSVAYFSRTIDMTAEDLFHELARDLGYNTSKKAWRKRVDSQQLSTPLSGEY